jgi:ABC-2 type transport system ATP-binding protein
MELKLEHVSKFYRSKQALRDVTLTIGNGVTGLLGPNGAGKTTLMRMLSTVEAPTKGIIQYNGKDIAKYPNELRSALGYLPQDFGVYPNLNALEFLEYLAAMKSLPMKPAKKRIMELLDILHLSEAYKRPLSTFSGGMKQRVGIAQALLNDPTVLIVDEPTVGLDPEERIQFRNLLSSLSRERIIILSTHIVTDIELIAPNIALLSNGELIAYACPEKLLHSVDGKVWSYVAPIGKIPELQSKFLISNSIQHSDGVHLRIISEKQPSLDASSIVPVLEDAYLYATTKGVPYENNFLLRKI